MLAEAMFYFCLTCLFSSRAHMDGMEAPEQVQDPQLADVQIEIVTKSEICEREAKYGDLLSVHYTGIFAHDQKKFDSSHDRGMPLNFQLGFGEVIPGWEKGLVGMCVGEVRKVTVPPHLGYGSKGTKTIPGDTTLHFEVKLEEIKDGSPPSNVFKHVDKNSDKKLDKEEVQNYIREQSKITGGGMAEVQVLNMASEIFQREDLNRDGAISYKEFTGPKRDEL